MVSLSKTPKVSVLMPAYNVEKYVGVAIESILNQTFTDFEFIIINDGSTDNTANIIAEYAKQDSRIRFINHKENRGLVPVLNEGLDLCRGEYIARMDSDDISLPERFAKQVEYMDAHPECGVLGTFLYVFYEDGRKSWIWKHPTKVCYANFFVHNPMGHPTAFIRKDVMNFYNIRYNPEYEHAEDYAIWLDFIQYTQIHNIPEPLYKYRCCYGENVSVVHHDVQVKNAEKIKLNAVKKITDDPKLQKFLLNYTTDVYQTIYLFGFIPIIRIKRYGEFVKTKYYILKKIPVITVRDGKIYLFEIIKIGNMK